MERKCRKQKYSNDKRDWGRGDSGQRGWIAKNEDSI